MAKCSHLKNMLKLTDQSRAFHHNFLSDFLHDILDKVNTIIGITFPNTDSTQNLYLGCFDKTTLESPMSIHPSVCLSVSHKSNFLNCLTSIIPPYHHLQDFHLLSSKLFINNSSVIQESLQYC